MYIPAHFEEKNTEVLHRLIDAHSFGTLITLGPAELNANHLPFELDRSAGQFGTLRTHVARANPVWQDTSSAINALAIFEGPAAYVSPGWYPSKQATGMAVPTYNYMVVHAYGPLQIVDDPVWMRAFLHRLTTRHEASQPVPWKLDEAPADYIDKMMKAIVGIEIPILKLQGKWKVSQNRQLADRSGVAQGLRGQGTPEALAMAEAVMARE